MPKIYGIPKSNTGLLSWSHVSKRMSESLHYWISTVDARGRPYATPVDGLWLDDVLYFGGSDETRRQRNMAANPEVCVHLESATDVIIIRGTAQKSFNPARELCVRLANASKTKYGYGPNPDDYAKQGVWILRPRVVLGWKQFPKDVTRWTAE
jgi:hypothetical protein